MKSREDLNANGYGLQVDNRLTGQDDKESVSGSLAMQEFNKFVGNSSAHGLKMVFDRQNGIGVVRRCTWGAFFAASVIALVVFLYLTYEDIMRYPFQTINSQKMMSPLSFPAITVCNQNTLDITKLPDDVAQSYLEFITATYTPGNTSYSTNATNSSTLGVGSLTVDTVVSDFITHCDYNDNTVNCSHIFYRYHIDYGNCYVFDPSSLDPATRRTSLRLTLFVNQAGYAPNKPLLGVMFHVHVPSESPDMRLPRHVASPGFYTNVAIRMSEHKYLPPPYAAFGDDGECADTETPAFRALMTGPPELYTGSGAVEGYSLDACTMARASDRAAHLCQCSPRPGLPYRLCQLEDYSGGCFGREYSRILDAAAASDFLGCPRPCHVRKHHATTSATYFPTPDSEGALTAQGLFPYNVTDLRLNYLQLNFHYDDLDIQTTEQVPIYKWNTIMGQLGGNMGFFVGASVLTLAELLDVAVCLSAAWCRSLWRRHRTKARSVSALHVKPV